MREWKKICQLAPGSLIGELGFGVYKTGAKRCQETIGIRVEEKSSVIIGFIERKPVPKSSAL